MGRCKKRKSNNYGQDIVQRSITNPNANYDHPEEEGAHLYTKYDELPWDLQPYWKHRRSIFSLYDDGIWTTDDSWFEVTHECVANKIAQHVAAAKPSNKIVMVDCFAGIGGNAIAFALSGYKRVYAIEKNAAALTCARHNARIYGVHDRITFFHGDCFELLGLRDGKSESTVKDLAEIIRKAGIIFASPPWGGPGYKDAGSVFDLNQMPYSLEYMWSNFSKITDNLVLYLPRTSDLNQIADCVGDGQKAQIVHYCIHENSKALCAYLGQWDELQQT